jgi:hypothetical protein
VADHQLRALNPTIGISDSPAGWFEKLRPRSQLETGLSAGAQDLFCHLAGEEKTHQHLLFSVFTETQNSRQNNHCFAMTSINIRARFGRYAIGV